MHTSSLRSLAFACLTSGVLLTTACKRETDAAPDEDITTAEDRSEDNVETAVSSDLVQSAGPADPQAQGSAFLIPDAAFRLKFGACVSRSYNFNTRTLTIDFGPTNCLCPDGRYRRGKILVRFTTDVLTRRAGAIATRQDYFVNDNQHTATRTFADLGQGSFSIDVADASIIRANNGGTHSWTASWTFTQTAGFGTPQFSDDVFSVTGTANGTNRRGVKYTTTVQTPLTKRGDCSKYYVAGALSITNSNARVMLLDYGNGACDNTVTVNGRTKTITLR